MLRLHTIFWSFFFFSRCADKILNQLEIHADAVIANGTANINKNNKDKSSLKNVTSDTPVIIDLHLMSSK